MKVDTKFLTEQKKLLEDRRTSLLQELDVDAVRNDRSGGADLEARFIDFGPKDDENAAEVETYGRNLSMEKNLEVSLFNVEKALKKIADGNYGLCEKCGRPIQPERLRAFPSATSCMDCKRRSL